MRQARPGLVPYFPLGFPDVETTIALVELAYELGIKVMEIGVPFSDPMADGTVIQAASDFALAQGVRFADLQQLPIDVSRAEHFAMTYANRFWKPGVASTCEHLQQMGFCGAIVPDLIGEHREDFLARVPGGFSLVPFLSTTTSEARLQQVATQVGEGFVYALSAPGVTGGSVDSFGAIAQQIERLRPLTTAPVCIGFGIRSRQAVERALEVADGAIVGTAIVERLDPARNPDENLAAVRELLEELMPCSD